MEEGYKDSVLKQLDLLSKGNKPFFLQYWPQHPLSFTRSDIREAKTLNGGPIADRFTRSMAGSARFSTRSSPSALPTTPSSW